MRSPQLRPIQKAFSSNDEVLECIYIGRRFKNDSRAVNFSLGLMPNIRHCERSEAIQKCHDRENWIAAPPPEARNDGMRFSEKLTALKTIASGWKNCLRCDTGMSTKKNGT
jgi:hypothetical protein